MPKSYQGFSNESIPFTSDANFLPIHILFWKAMNQLSTYTEGLWMGIASYLRRIICLATELYLH